ncbi:hypothetical protein EDD15DRAFT_2362665 [Pisolithus albus]|nr:hypothetical protein EDD15DRAFT_2362665 [Pisolithus albus]
MARDAFTKLDEAVSSENRQAWSIQEESALGGRVRDVSVMDIFEIQLKKAPTVRAVELELLEAPSQRGTRQGATSWITRGLGIEESEITLAITRKDSSKYPSETKRLAMAWRVDRLAVDRSGFIADGQIYLAPLHQGTDADDYTPLPLPSNFGIERCRAAGADELVEMELKLRIGQANDALHGLRIALADKAVAFRGVVRKATSYSMRTCAWQMVNSIDISVRQQAAIYKRCREQLQKSHMAVHTAAFSQNAHDHRSSNLPWFWCMDIPRTTSSKNWLTEFYCIHWFRAKAVKDRWEEEEDLLVSEFHWTMNFFKFRVKKWNKKCLSFKAAGLHGAACYAARQKAVYDWLAEQGASKWLNMSPEILPLNQ